MLKKNRYLAHYFQKKEMISNMPRITRKYPGIPENTQSSISTLIPDLPPGIFSYTRPDPILNPTHWALLGCLWVDDIVFVRPGYFEFALASQIAGQAVTRPERPARPGQVSESTARFRLPDCQIARLSALLLTSSDQTRQERTCKTCTRVRIEAC